MIFLIWVVTLAPLPWPVTPVMAATFTVTSTADNTTDDNSCTLREAIMAANNNAANDDCDSASSTDDTITFDVSGPITLDSNLGTLPAIVSGAGKLTIDGTGQSITISGNNDGVFRVNPGGDLTLKHLTVSNGWASYGGGIYNNSGTVTITNSTISNNRASAFGGGIYNNSGTVTIQSSTISGNRADERGGGIYSNGGTVTITNSILSSNSADRDEEDAGGGIHNFGAMVTIQSSTISNNSAPRGDGGGIANFGTVTISKSTLSSNNADRDGGGIYNDNGAVTLTNSTISGNSANDEGGGIYNNRTVATVTITSSTLSGNSASEGGGGIFNFQGTVKLKNTIVANSPSGENCLGGVEASGTNLATDDSCGTGFMQVTSEQLNLGSLANNGGPTETHALQSGSAAIDAVTDCTDLQSPPQSVGTDQRGVTRPQPTRGACDVGAFELVQAATTGTIIVNKDVVPDDNSQWQISVTGQSPQTIGDRGQATFANLTAGQYTVSESGPSGYTSSVACGSKGSASGTQISFTLNAGETVTCTFTNVQQGTIVIQKTAIGGDGRFGFSGSNGIGSFSITTSSGSGERSFSLAPGTYTVTESTLPTGWAFQNLACQVTGGTSSTTSIDLNMRRASIALAAGETVTCTFTNTRVGVNLFVLQGNGHCLEVDRDRRIYRFRAANGRVFTGPLTFTQRGSKLEFQSPRGQSPLLKGTIDLNRRTGSAALVAPLSQGGGRYVITDRNIDDNGACP